MGARSRKRRRAEEREEFTERYRERSEARNARAREALEPIAPGERPRAVTVAAVAAFLLGLTNVVFYVAGGTIRGERPTASLAYSALMFVAAWGAWRSRYWAVLGIQALLGILVVIFGVLLLVAQNVLAALVSIVIVVAAGTLFWYLVKALARIQMPERP